MSKYSGGFDLMDSMIIPKPCAYRSANLTSVQYYRGQNPKQYDISEQNSQGNIVTQMSTSSNLIYQNGLLANDIAEYEQSSYSVYI